MPGIESELATEPEPQTKEYWAAHGKEAGNSWDLISYYGNPADGNVNTCHHFSSLDELQAYTQEHQLTIHFPEEQTSQAA